MNLHNILTIARREIKSFFDNPTAYIVLIVFLFLWEFLFFRQVFLVEEASLRILFDFLPWLLLLLVGAMTMGSISSEKHDGTLELVLTHPVTDLELLLGKFVSVLFFVALAILAAVPIGLSLHVFGQLDWGVVAGQIIGSVLTASVLTALGIFVSSLVASPIAALLTILVAGFFLIVAGIDLVTASLPLSITPFFERLSLLTHYVSITRGVIDVSDVWYFVSATAAFLSLAYLQFMRRKHSHKKQLYRQYQTGIFLFLVITILTNVIGNRIPGRIDLTANRLYTISPATEKIVGELDDVVGITLYASDKLPPQLSPVLRDTRDILRDYARLGQGNIQVQYKNPSGNAQVAQEAQSAGVQEIQFNVLGQEEFQVKTGFLGLSVSFGTQHEAMPFIEQTADLEYQLTSAIKKLTNENKKKIAFLAGHGEKSLAQDLTLLEKELSKQFELETVTLDDKTSEIATDSSVLVIAGPTQKMEDAQKQLIKKYADSGRATLFLLDTIIADPQTLSVIPNPESLADFVKEYGVEIAQDVVYDLRANETIRLGSGGVQYLLPYPPWTRVIPADSVKSIVGNLQTVVLPWGSSLSIDDKIVADKKLTKTELLKTSQSAGTQLPTAPIGPDTKWSEENLKEHIVAVSLESENKSKTIVIGDSDFMVDGFIQNVPQNAAFMLSILGHLTGEESLGGLQIKNQSVRKFLFTDASQPSLIKYANIFLAVIIPAGYGLLRILQRRNLRKRKFL